MNANMVIVKKCNLGQKLVAFRYRTKVKVNRTLYALNRTSSTEYVVLAHLSYRCFKAPNLFMFKKLHRLIAYLLAVNEWLEGSRGNTSTIPCFLS